MVDYGWGFDEKDLKGFVQKKKVKKAEDILNAVNSI